MIDRFVIWTEAIEEIKEKPLLGHGFNKFLTDPTKTKPEYFEFAYNENNPHNSYLYIAHSSGLIGYISFWLTFGSILYLLKSRCSIIKSEWSSIAYGYLCGLFVAGIFDKTFFITQIVLLLSFLCGIAFGRGEEYSD